MDTTVHYAVDTLGPITAVRHTDVPLGGQTQSGYGKHLPTGLQVQFSAVPRWYRVRVTCYSNAGTAYVSSKHGAWLVVRDSDMPAPEPEWRAKTSNAS